MTKGILIIFMLAHHVFYPDQLEVYEINTFLNNQNRIVHLVSFFRICVAGFSFLSAFGMTRILKNKPLKSPQETMRFFLYRLIRLESSVVIIYIFAVLYRQFIMGQPVSELYSPLSPGIIRTALAMLLDVLGLAAYLGSPLLNATWWYLSYAVLLITVMPFLFKAYEKYRYSLLPAACMVSMLLPLNRLEFWVFLPSAFLGCAFAYENWFERLYDWKKGNKLIKAGKFIACLLLLCLSYYLLNEYIGIEICSLFVFVIPYMVYEFIAPVPGLRSCLEFLGKHATNIFLTHTFLYLYFCSDFIYSFRDSWKIMSVLLGLSLALSVLLELFKKYTGYNRLTEKLLQLAAAKEQTP